MLACSVAVAIAGLLLASTRLRLDANTDNLIAPGRPFMQDYRAFLDEFGDLEFIWIVVDAEPDRLSAEAAVEDLIARLQGVPGLRAVHGFVGVDEQLRIATRAMEEDQLAETASVAEALGLLAGIAEATAIEPRAEPAALRATRGAERLLERAMRGGSAVVAGSASLGDARLDDPRARAAGSAVLMLSAVLAGADEGRRAALGALGGSGALAPVNLRSETGRYLLIQILPEKDFTSLTVIEGPLRAVRRAIDATRAAYPEVAMGLTGKPVLQADELITSTRDMVRGAAIGIVLCTLLLVVTMRSVLRPLLAVAAFLVAFCWTYGFATLAVGRLNLLSNVFMIVLVAAGVDYGVHMLARYFERRRTPGITTIESVVRDSTVDALRGNATGAATSCAVFLAALATNFQGLRELGAIAAAGLLLCVLAMGLVLPALLTITDRRLKLRVPPLGRAASFGLPARRPWVALAGLAAISLALVWGVPRVRFEDNLLALQNPVLDSVRWERRLAEESSGNSWFGAVVVDSLEEIAPVLARAEAQPAIGTARSALDAVRPESPRRRALRDLLRSGAAAGGRAPPSAAGDDRTDGTAHAPSAALADALERTLGGLSALALGAAARESAGDAAADGAAAELRRVIESARRGALLLRGPEGSEALRSMNASTLRAGEAAEALLAGDALPLREALPAALRDRSVSASGRFLVMLHPRENVWDVEHMRPFIEALRAVDPGATGVPFTHYLSLLDMRRAFGTMALISIALVAALVWLDFRRPADVLLALSPVAMALLWLFGIMGASGIPLNLANFFAVPILIGLGVDSAVHLLHRYRAVGVDRLNPGSTLRAVVVTNVTTSIGFAPLILADHLGMRSLGLVMVIGNSACLASSLVLLPALLALRERRRTRRSDLPSLAAEA